MTETYPRYRHFRRHSSPDDIAEFTAALAADGIVLDYAVSFDFGPNKKIYDIKLTIPDESAYTLYLLKYNDL